MALRKYVYWLGPCLRCAVWPIILLFIFCMSPITLSNCSQYVCLVKLSCCKFCIYTHPVNSKFTTWHGEHFVWMIWWFVKKTSFLSCTIILGICIKNDTAFVYTNVFIFGSFGLVWTYFIESFFKTLDLFSEMGKVYNCMLS